MSEEKFVRTKTYASGKLTDEEHAALKVHTQKWIDIALRTDQVDSTKIVPAIRGLYRAVDLKEPVVMLAPSPMAMTVAFGLLSVLAEKPKIEVPAGDTYLHRVARAFRAGEDFVDNNWDTDNLPNDPVPEMIKIATEIAGNNVIAKMKGWEYSYQGGNMWASNDCYITAMRDVIGLDLPEHVNYAFWEAAAINGGFRVMHEDFCIVSDFPSVIKIDERSLAHSQAGPSHMWRDGWRLYYWHGVSIPAEWYEDPNYLTAERALQEQNVELRRCACEMLGWAKILKDLDATVIDADGDPEIGSLIEADIPNVGREKFLFVKCGTGRDFAIPVPPDITTAIQGQAWSWGLDEKTFTPPEVRT